MMIPKCREIMTLYRSFINQSFKVEETEYGCRVTTPFLTLNNDTLKLYVEDAGSGRVRVTDFGDALGELDLSGFDYSSSPKRKKILEGILKTSGAVLADNNVEIICSLEETPYAINKMISAMSSIKHLIILETPYEEYNFAQIVHDELVQRKVNHRYQDEVEVEGVPFKMDLRIPSPKEDNLGRCVQTLHVDERGASTYRAQMKTYPFLYLRTKEVDFNAISIVDKLDEVWTPRARKFIEDSSDFVLDWSDKDEILAALS